MSVHDALPSPDELAALHEPVSTSPIDTQADVIDDEALTLVDGPVQTSETLIDSVVAVSEVVSSGNQRGRGLTLAEGETSSTMGLVLTEIAPPYPNATPQADLPARHGIAERVSQQFTVASASTAEDPRNLRPGNRTRSPSQQRIPVTTPVATESFNFLEQLRFINARVTALETAQVENVQDQKTLKSEIRLIQVGLEEVRTEVLERNAETIQRVDQHHVLTSRVNEKLDEVMNMLSTQHARPPHFELSTPVPSPPGIMHPGVMETHTIAQAQRSPHFRLPDERPSPVPDARPIPEIPTPRWMRGAQHTSAPMSPPMMSFANNEQQDGYRQREWQPDGQGVTREQGPSQSMWGKGTPIMTNQNFRICQKPNPRLFVFDGMMLNYKLWASRVRDHLCNRSTRRYESLLRNIEKSPDEISKSSLLVSTVDGVNSWEIAEELEGFLFDFVNTNLYDRRTQFTNNEAGNGFEAWRQIFQEFAGGSSMANVGGFRRIQEYPKCEDIRRLGQHLADWEELINLYGKNLQSCPEELRTMTLGIIPSAFEDELLPKEVEYPTWRSILVFCRKRTRHLQHREYADLVRHPKSPSVKHSVHAFNSPGPHPSDADIPSSTRNGAVPSNGAPSWATDLINAVRDMRSASHAATHFPPPPAPHGAARPPNGRAKAKAKPKAGAGRFIFRGCFECGSDDHLRAECPAWKRILDSSGAPPAQHKGARDKAYASWKEKKQRARVNSFEGELDGDDDDELIDGEWDPMNLSLVTQGTSWDDAHVDEQPINDNVHVNSFASLNEDANHSSDDYGIMVDQLNSWAHVVVSKKNAKPQKAKRGKERMDLSLIKPLPDDFKELVKLAKNHPSDTLLKPGEQWLMFDTGANVDAADIEEHFPEYANYVVPLDDPNAHGGAECASGNVVKCRGQVTVHGSIDGQPTSIPFRDMKIRMPIASLKKRVVGEDGYDVFITWGGAVMRHRRSKKVVKLYDRGGVYFAKFRPRLPSAPKNDPDSPFGRLG